MLMDPQPSQQRAGPHHATATGSNQALGKVSTALHIFSFHLFYALNFLSANPNAWNEGSINLC